ncbi:hypothetical protein, partial [Enterobacter hormaechei]|uniref:hypothetical protein n=3 Tax=Enterobacter hormaechei TaxID=158836 RepID=UPI0038B334DA
MTITVGYPQTNRKTDTGKTLKPWPVLVDHFKQLNPSMLHFLAECLTLSVERRHNPKGYTASAILSRH